GVASAEVEAESIVRDAVAVVAAALLPGAVLGRPRTCARLQEAAAHLRLLLRDAAGVNAAKGGRGGRLDAAMVGAAVGRLRALRGGRRPGGRPGRRGGRRPGGRLGRGGLVRGGGGA